MRLQECFKCKWRFTTISILIQKSTYQPCHRETVYVLSFLTTHTSNIPITLVSPFSISSLSSDTGLSPFLWSSPFPSKLRTSEIEFDVVGISSIYHHLASGKRQQDEQTNAWSGKFFEGDSTFWESQVKHISKCPERSLEISDFLQTVCTELPSDSKKQSLYMLKVQGTACKTISK